jgi:arsenate reductase
MRFKTTIIAVLFSIITFKSFAQSSLEFNKQLQKYAEEVSGEFNQISEDRKKTLVELGDFIIEDKIKNNKVSLIFVCTSNSRRSHLSQVWMQTAAIYFGIDSVFTFSGGTEATELNPRAADALRRAGFSLSKTGTDYNSPYVLSIGKSEATWRLFSKKYDDEHNPKSNFIAVMVCSEADKSCPIVPGSNGRIGLPFDDPKIFDNSPSEQQKYDETCRLIAREMLFVADYVKSKLTKKIK